VERIGDDAATSQWLWKQLRDRPEILGKMASYPARLIQKVSHKNHLKTDKDKIKI
jgi:hypothetical protein